MKVIILAAGRGSRMASATKDIPKCMLKLGGISLLERQIKTLNEAGIKNEDIIIVTGYKSECISIEGSILLKNENWKTTNMVSTLLKADVFLNSEECIVCYSDIVYESSCIKTLVNDKREIVIPYYTKFEQLWNLRFDNPLDDIESFKLEDGRILEIGKKVSSMAEIQGQYMGILKFTPNGWEQVKNVLKLPCEKPVEKLDMTTLLNNMIKNGIDVFTIPYSGLWLECDDEHDIEVYEKNLNLD